MKPFENNGLANIVQHIRMVREGHVKAINHPNDLFIYIEQQALKQIAYNNRRANGEDIAWHDMENPNV